MLKRIHPSTIIATAALFFSLGGASLAAGATSAKPVAILRVTAHSGQVMTAKTRQVFGAKTTVVTYVYVNGREIPTADRAAALTILYAGNGTLVQSTVSAGAGPATVKVTTWLPVAHVVVRFVPFR